MGAYIIRGGYPLDSPVQIYGAENSVLPTLVAYLLAPGKYVVHNCPELSDVAASLDIPQHLGYWAKRQGDVVVVDAPAPTGWDVLDALIREMHPFVIFLGVVLDHMGRVKLCAPDGCKLGPRPIDLHLGAIRGLGDHIIKDGGGLWVEGALRRVDLVLFLPSVGAMENTMLAAVCTAGTTIITNAAREPEIVDLQGSPRAVGTKVHRTGGSVITVEGDVPLHDGSHAVMGDCIIATTCLAAAVSIGGVMGMTGVDYRHLPTVSVALWEAGCDVQSEVESVRLRWDGPLQGVRSVRMAPYPGFPIDTQAPLMAALIRGKDCTVLVENIFESHYRHVDELFRMGADIRVEDRVAVVYGVPRLHGVQVRATDLRGGVALAVVALGAEGRSKLTGVHRADRGYQFPEGDLHRLDAGVRRT